MNRSDFAAVALLKARAVFTKREPTPADRSAAPLNDNLASATFLELEPDLAKEAGERLNLTFG